MTNFLLVTNIFPRLKLTPTKNFYQLFFLLNKKQTTEILKNLLSDLIYHNLVERRHTAADQSKLVSYTDSSSEEEDLHVLVNFDEPIDLAINQFSIFKIEFQKNK